MHNDEEATHAKLAALLTEAVHPAIAEHGGRIVKNTGDGFLAEFPSAIEAVRAAVQFQNHIPELTAGDAEDRRLAFRVGVNIGDVIVEPHDIFGDGVNIAARLESIAEPGGICISSSAYDNVRGKVGVEFADLGEQNLKNIGRPVRVYAVISDGPRSAAHAERAEKSLLSPPRLSIVVLPFANLSGDPEQDYFVDGVTESLTTDLSRIGGGMAVIARNSAFSYKGKAIDVRQVGRELNVRYVLEGSVQRSGNRLRVNVQLIDAESGRHLWAERFEKPVADFFKGRNRIEACPLIGCPTRCSRGTTSGAFPASRCNGPELSRSRLHVQGGTAEHLTQVRDFFERALVIDPRSIRALVGLASVELNMGGSLLADDRTARCAAAETHAIKALSLVPDHAGAHLILGSAYILTNRAARGIAECEQTLTLDSNSADAHGMIGLAKYCMGRAAETEGHIHEAFRLSPRDIFAYRWMYFIGVAKLQLGADTEAAVWLRRSIEANRNYPVVHFALAAVLGLLGALDEARSSANVGLALNPSLTIRRVRLCAPSDNQMYLAGLERICQGLRIAGVPEG
jgi:TolB-like protein